MSDRNCRRRESFCRERIVTIRDDDACVVGDCTEKAARMIVFCTMMASVKCILYTADYSTPFASNVADKRGYSS